MELRLLVLTLPEQIAIYLRPQFNVKTVIQATSLADCDFYKVYLCVYVCLFVCVCLFSLYGSCLFLAVAPLQPSVSSGTSFPASDQSSSITLTCAPDASNSGESGLTYTWTKDGANIVTDNSSPDYTIATLDFTHSGVYACIVKNSGSESSPSSADLTVSGKNIGYTWN